MQPLVSVIIPAFNRGKLIGETLASVAAQQYKNWECIVVDDGSDDDTLQVAGNFAASDARFKIFSRPGHLKKGANNSRNFGFQQSSGSLVLFFDSDDLMLPGKLLLQVESLADPGIDYCVDRFDNFSDGERPQPEWAFDENLNAGVALRDYVVHEVFWGTINFMGRRDLFLKSEFHEDLKSGQEYYFFTSVAVNNPKAKGVFLNRTLSLRRIHSASIQQEQRSLAVARLENKFAVYWKVLEDFGPSLDDRAVKYLLRSAVVFYHKLLLAGKNLIGLRPIYTEIFRKFGMQKGLTSIAPLLAGRYLRMGDRWGSAVLNRNLK